MKYLSHKNGFLGCNKSYLQDVEKCKNVLPNTNLFRPPYGKITPWKIRKVKENYKIIMWDVLSYDFDKNPLKNHRTDQNGSLRAAGDFLKVSCTFSEHFPKEIRCFEGKTAENFRLRRLIPYF